MSTNISETNSTEQPAGKGQADEARRNFLRKSLYIAYATPVIVPLLAEKASAVASWGDNNNGSTVIPPPPRP